MTELALFGTDLFGETIKPKASGPVAERFTLPPFTILDARSGEWQERKRAWHSLGICGEIGRDSGLTYMAAAEAPAYWAEKMGSGFAGKENGTSIFDPVVCELAYTWFAPVGGVVLDPFAGGSVRGIVASKLKRQYIGHELKIGRAHV